MTSDSETGQTALIAATGASGVALTALQPRGSSALAGSAAVWMAFARLPLRRAVAWFMRKAQLQGARKLAEHDGTSAEVRSAIDRAGELVREGLADARQAFGALRSDLPAVRELESLVGLVDGVEIVGSAEDDGEAVEMARSQRPDVVLMDLRMPEPDGVEATRRSRAELPETRCPS